MAKILVQITESTSKVQAEGNIEDRMMNFYVDGTTEGFVYRKINDTYMNFSSDEHMAESSNDFASSIGINWSGAATDVNGAIEEIKNTVAPGGDISSSSNLTTNRLIISDGIKSIASSGTYVDSDTIIFDVKTSNRSNAQQQKFQHSLVDKNYVDSKDSGSILNGVLTFIDSDDQGDQAFKPWSDGRFIFVANWTGGLLTYSVSDSGILTFIDSDDQGGNATGVWGNGNLIFLANWTLGLLTYRVSDTGILTQLGSDNQGGEATGVWGDGRFIFLANGTSGISTYSVSDSGILTFIDSDDQGGNAKSVWGDGRFIFVANDTGGLLTYSVSDSGILTFIDSDNQGGQAIDVWGNDRFIFLANYTGGLLTYRVSDTGILTLIDSDYQGADLTGVHGSGKLIYAAGTTGGLLTYSVSDSGILTFIDSDDQGDQARAVWVDPRFIFVANDTGGLLTYSTNKAYEYDKGEFKHNFVGDMVVDTIDSSGGDLSIETVLFNNGAITAATVATNIGLYSDNIYEKNAGNGVTIDGVVCKDSDVLAIDLRGLTTVIAGSPTDTTAILRVDGADPGKASINIESGSNPTSPNDGDFWWNGTNLYFRDGSNSIDLLTGGANGGAGVQTRELLYCDVNYALGVGQTPHYVAYYHNGSDLFVDRMQAYCGNYVGSGDVELGIFDGSSKNKLDSGSITVSAAGMFTVTLSSGWTLEGGGFYYFVLLNKSTTQDNSFAGGGGVRTGTAFTFQGAAPAGSLPSNEATANTSNRGLYIAAYKA